ncbi:glycosyltransferase [Ramlibacter algicola]
MALDEYLVPLAFAKRTSWRIAARRVVAFKYRVWADGRGFHDHLNRAATSIALSRTSGELVVFDERLRGTRIAGQPVHIVPDPWFGLFNAELRSEARARFGFSEEDFVALTIGFQDARKGFPLVLAASERALRDSGRKLFIVGNIKEEFKPRLLALKAKFPAQIVHLDRFVEEGELPYVFAAADVTLLPYAKSFTASSGVLPRSCASSVPVIACSHGLVGYRARTYDLGIVINTDCPSALATAIDQMSVELGTNRTRWARSLSQFSQATSLRAFEESVWPLFHD